MSIRTYFENIANAIKTKNPAVTSVTPSEMPEQILNIGGDEMECVELYSNPTFNTRPDITLSDSIFNYKLLLFEFHRQYSIQSQIMTAIISTSGIQYFINKATAPVANIKLSAVAADGWILYNYVDETHFNFEIASSSVVYIDRVVGIK